MCKVSTDASVSINCDENTRNYLPKLANPDPIIVCPNWENERPPMALVRVDSVVPFKPVVSIQFVSQNLADTKSLSMEYRCICMYSVLYYMHRIFSAY